MNKDDLIEVLKTANLQYEPVYPPFICKFFDKRVSFYLRDDLLEYSYSDNGSPRETMFSGQYKYEDIGIGGVASRDGKNIIKTIYVDLPHGDEDTLRLPLYRWSKKI